MNKSTVLQDYNGNNIYPITSYQGVFGLPSVTDKFKIFYGSGRPSTIMSDYNNIMINDIYIDTNAQNRVGCFHGVMNLSEQNDRIYWRCFGNYVIETIDPPTNYLDYNWYYYPYPKVGVLWLNTTNNKLFVFITWSGTELIWKNITDIYTKPEIDALFNDFRFKLNKKAKPVVETATDSPITLEDSSNRDIKELTIYGKSEQVKTNGYQLLERMVGGTTYTNRGVTVKFKDNGSIYILGSLTGTGGLDIWLNPNTALNPGTYYIKGIGFSSKVQFIIPNGITKTGNFSQVLTLAEGRTYAPKLYIQEGTSNINVEIFLMVESGSVSHDYESYTGAEPSPSIDYPQNISDITNEVIDINKRNCISLSEVTKGTIGIPNTASYQYDTTNEEFVITTNSFEGTKEIIFGTYSLEDGKDITNSLHRFILMNVKEGSMPKFRSKNGIFTKPIPTFMDKNNKVIKTYTGSLSNNTLVVPKGAVKMGLRVSVENATGDTTYRDNIMITFDESLLSKWEAPSNNQIATFTKTLRGIPVSSGGNYTDNNGQQWICDTIERYADGSGKLIQRIARASTDARAQITKQTSSTNNIYNIRWNHTNTPTAPKPIYDYYTVSNIKTELFLFKTNQQINAGEKGAAIFQNGSNSWILKCGCTLNKFPTLDDFTTWVNNNPFDVVYAIETPIETPLTAEELAQLDLSTYKPITNIVSNTDVEITYVADTKNYIDKRMTELQNAIISQGGNI